MIELESGEKFPQPLFWIPYESAREVFVQAPFYNRSNSAANLSYDDVFIKRMFDSYIFKEENVYDRSIQEYAQGVDALLESERIKNSLIEFEEYLWEYWFLKIWKSKNLRIWESEKLRVIFKFSDFQIFKFNQKCTTYFKRK